MSVRVCSQDLDPGKDCGIHTYLKYYTSLSLAAVSSDEPEVSNLECVILVVCVCVCVCVCCVYEFPIADV